MGEAEQLAHNTGVFNHSSVAYIDPRPIVYPGQCECIKSLPKIDLEVGAYWSHTM